MNGVIVRALRAGCLTAVLGTTGCVLTGYRDVVDPCYPAHYNLEARQEVIGALAPQVANGHVLDQTVWNSYFDPGTDRLTPGGQEHLAYLARRRPAPDPMVFVQTAQDLASGYDQDHPERYIGARSQLDSLRVQAVQNYLAAYTGGHCAFNVVVHDPPDAGISTIPVNVAVQKNNLNFDGVLRTYGSSSSSSGGR